jgi:UDP-N-acetylmuramate dehydrogenase
MVEQPSVRPTLPMATLLAAFGPNLEIARELAPLTTYNTGGKARFFISAGDASEIVKVISGAQQLGIPFFLIGGGSNLLISDSGYEGLIVKVDVRGMELSSPKAINCGAGVELMSLVDFATTNELTGLEFAAGIWGSVGGAICGNAGAFGGDMSSVLSEVTVVTGDGRVKTVGRDYCRFEYRDSYLKKTSEVVVTAKFELEPGKKQTIQSKVDEILKHRSDRHPVDSRTAGSFFKNVPDASQPHGKLAAGKLLEDAGAKGLSVGGAKVFDKHANIIVNTGKATTKDIRQLADIMKQKVLDKFGIELEEEVVSVGDF